MKGKILLICLISVVILPIYGVEQIPERELISNIELLKKLKDLVN